MCVCVYWSNQIPLACFTAKLQQSDNVGVSVNGGLLYVYVCIYVRMARSREPLPLSSNVTTPITSIDLVLYSY